MRPSWRIRLSRSATACLAALPWQERLPQTASVMISIAGLEVAAAPSWRALEEDKLGDWLLRAADGFTGRANSALAVGDPGVPLADAIEVVGRWYRARDLPAMIAVPYPAAQPDNSELDLILARLGWTVRADAATVMTAATAVIAGYADRVAARVAMSRRRTPPGLAGITTGARSCRRWPSGC